MAASNGKMFYATIPVVVELDLDIWAEDEGEAREKAESRAEYYMERMLLPVYPLNPDYTIGEPQVEEEEPDTEDDECNLCWNRA